MNGGAGGGTTAGMGDNGVGGGGGSGGSNGSGGNGGTSVSDNPGSPGSSSSGSPFNTGANGGTGGNADPAGTNNGGGGGGVGAPAGGGGGGASFVSNVVTGAKNIQGVQSGNGKIILTYITPIVTPTLMTTVIQKRPPANNRSVADVATLLGGNNPQGSITFYLYDEVKNSQTCSGAIKETSPPIPVNGNGIYESPTFKIMGAAGTYAFKAVYSGDSNNNSVTSLCEPFHVPGSAPDPPPDPPKPCHKSHHRKPECCAFNLCCI